MNQFLSFPSFCLTLLQLVLINKPVASLNEEKSLLREESAMFISSGGKNETEMEITYLGLENFYRIDNEYTFFIPEVSVECECACTAKYEENCTEKTHKYSRDCGSLINSTSRCTIYNSMGKDTSVCPEYYTMCCRTFFTKMKSMNSYKALQLKYHKSILKLQIHLKSPNKKKENIIANITAPIKYLQINMEHVLQIFHSTPDRLLPDRWYYAQEELNELFFSENINELKDEKKLNKLGWFYFIRKDQRLSSLRINDLNERLSVKPSKCHTAPPKYEWTLNAEGYYSEGLLRMPRDLRRVSEMFETSVKKISVNIKEKIIKIEAKRDPTVDRDLISVSSFPFMFISKLFLSTKKEPLLHLIFTKGNGSISIEITNPYWKDTITFSKDVTKASVNDPVTIFSYPLPFINVVEVCLVCTTQDQQKLCQSPIIIRERSTTGEELTRSTNTSTQITQESIKQGDEGKNQSIYPNPWTLTYIMIVVTSVCIFIMIGTVLILPYIKKRKRKQLKGLADVESESETKPLVNSSTKNVEMLPESIQLNEKLTSSGLRKRMQKKQKKEFKERTSSLEEQHIEISMKVEKGKGEEEDGNKIGKEEIFKEQKNGNPRRILVEDPQSKLLEELLLDWTKGVMYMNDKFDLVFVIMLNDEHCETNIEKHLLEQCQEIEGTEKEKLEAIQEIEGRVLLLLVGLDEASPEMRKSSFLLIAKKYYPNMTVICFCKAEDFHLGNETDETLDQLGSGEGEYYINWDKQFKIKAI